MEHAFHTRHASGVEWSYSTQIAGKQPPLFGGVQTSGFFDSKIGVRIYRGAAVLRENPAQAGLDYPLFGGGCFAQRICHAG
jgi:hypothetical protein